MTDFGTTPVSDTTLAANTFPVSAAFVPGTASGNLTAVEGILANTDGNGFKSTAIRVGLKDGDDVTLGASGDANTANTVMGRLTKIRDLLNTTLAVTQSGTWNITNISGTISLPTGASTSAKQPALGTAGTASSDVLTVQGITSMTALKVDGSGVTQPVSLTSTTITGTVAVTESGTWSVRNQDGAGNALTTNSSTYTAKFAQDTNLLGTLGTAFSTAGKVDVKGADGDVFVRQTTGSNLHVQVDSAPTTAVTQSGTWTVQPGNTANTTPWLTSPQAASSGGATSSHTITAASTNATSLKGSAGVVWGVDISNSNASARYFKLYDKASAPTVGTDTPKRTFQVPGNGTLIRAFPVGLNFPTGIAWAMTTGIADSDTGAVGTDISVDVDYK